MPINEKTREQRISRWARLKQAWESKLAKAANQNDTDVAKKMIAEAEEQIKRLEQKDEAFPEEVIRGDAKPATKNSRKTKEDTGKLGL